MMITQLTFLLLCSHWRFSHPTWLSPQEFLQFFRQLISYNIHSYSKVWRRTYCLPRKHVLSSWSVFFAGNRKPSNRIKRIERSLYCFLAQFYFSISLRFLYSAPGFLPSLLKRFGEFLKHGVRSVWPKTLSKRVSIYVRVR